ncbi:MAG: PTS sugar transporter subunit IIC [Erysipelotrichaceae bacterium]|nr:PTS sugar transporter subunit IIC [Erysipelotrichaceae bacterium]
MEGLFQSSFLNKLQEVGQKICANSFVSALQAGMMGTMSIIMTGSVFQIVCAILSMVGVDTTSTLYTILYMPYNFTMGLIGLWITIMIAYNYAKAVGVKSPLLSCIEAAAFYVLTACFDLTQGSSIVSLNITYLGSQGLFLGFLVAFVVVRIDLLCQEKKIYIRMPDVCPPSLVNSMAAIVPSFFNACIFLGLSALVYSMTAGAYNLASGFMAILSVPLMALTSLPGMFVLAFIAGVMWCFGIHGTMLMVSVLMGPIIMVAAENAAIWEASIQAGATFAEATKALKFYPVALFGSIAICGGTGNTLPLCIMGLKAKSEQIRAVSKISLVPGWFGINEPVTFGMPVMYNPILAIPYITAMLVAMLCTLIGYKIGFLAPGHVYVGALMPMGFAQFLSTFRWQNALWDYLMLIPCGLVWYPFFKMYDNQLAAQEAAAKENPEA